MDLNLFENLKKNIEDNSNIKNFMKELSNFLSNMASSKTKDTNINNSQKIKTEQNEKTITLENQEQNLQENRKEGHLYLITEDRNNEVYLWDFTDKPKHEFSEKMLSEDLLSVAKEGAMLQYKNGKYELYSPYGYDMLFNEENNKEQ